MWKLVLAVSSLYLLAVVLIAMVTTDFDTVPSAENKVAVFFAIARASNGQYMPVVFPELSEYVQYNPGTWDKQKQMEGFSPFWQDMKIVPEKDRGHYSYVFPSQEEADRAAAQATSSSGEVASYSITVEQDSDAQPARICVRRTSNSTMQSVYLVEGDELTPLSFNDGRRGRRSVFLLMPLVYFLMMVVGVRVVIKLIFTGRGVVGRHGRPNRISD